LKEKHSFLTQRKTAQERQSQKTEDVQAARQREKNKRKKGAQAKDANNRPSKKQKTS
jgi:hypothetical protein